MTNNDNPERGQYPQLLRDVAELEEGYVAGCTRPFQFRQKALHEQTARAARAGAEALEAPLESPTLANVGARLAELVSHQGIMLHCGRFSRVWWAQLREGDNVLARAEGNSPEAAIMALLWPEGKV